MPQVSYPEPIAVSQFRCEIDGVQLRVNKIGLPEWEVPMAEMVNGGDPFVRKVVSGPAKCTELVITRYIDGSPEDATFRDIFRQCFNPTGTSGASSVRHTIAVVALNQAGTEVERRIYYECFPTKYVKTEKDAASTDLETEEFTFAVDWWEVV